MSNPLKEPAPTRSNILVFDSGVGGLSIVEPIRNSLPGYSISYLADNGGYPYGLLDENVLIERVCTLITKVANLCQPDIIIIACNSASTLVLPRLRDLLTQPIIGVVPAIKPAAQQSASSVIGLLATPGTIGRDYTDKLIADFAPHCKIVSVGSAELVELVENKYAGKPVCLHALENILEPFKASVASEQMDTVVLACTHFPLIKQELAEAMPEITHWVDCGTAIANRAKALLDGISVNSASSHGQLFTTQPQGCSASLQEKFRQDGFTTMIAI